MTNEEKWFDYWCIKNFGQDWYMCVNDLKTHLIKHAGSSSDELDQIFYFLRNRKIFPSFNYIKDGSCDCMNFNFTSYSDFLKVFDCFFKAPKLTITVNISESNKDDIQELLSDERISSSKHFETLKKIYARRAKDNVFRILCILAMIADEMDAINPHFTYVFTNVTDAVEAKGGNWQERIPEAKYAKVVVAKYKTTKDETDMKELIDLSYFNGNGDIEILRYRNPEDKLEVNGKYVPQNFTTIRKFPCFDCGAFGDANEKYFIIHINLHAMVGDTEFRRACKSAGALGALVALHAGETPLINIVGMSDTEFNLFDLKAGSYYVKEGYEKVSAYRPNAQANNVTCIYKDDRIFDALLVKTGFDYYDSYCYKKTLFLDNLSVGYEYMKDHFSDYMTPDPFNPKRYKFIIPLLIYPRTYLRGEERAFSKLVRAERIMKLWICGGWRCGAYLNFLRFDIEPIENEEQILKDYILEHFKLFPCITIKKYIQESQEIDFGEYEKITGTDEESNKRKPVIKQKRNGRNNNKGK